MGDPLSAISVLVEFGIFGERRIYNRVRSLLYPLLEAEMEACLERSKKRKEQQSSGNNNRESAKNDNAPISVMRSMVEIALDKDCKGNETHFKLLKEKTANRLYGFALAAVGNTYTGASWALFHILSNTNGIGMAVRNELCGETATTSDNETDKMRSSKNDNNHNLNAALQQGPTAMTKRTTTNGNGKNEIPPFLQACVLEVTRLYTPGHLLRAVKREIVLPASGTCVAPGTVIAMNSFNLGRLSFSNPKSFDPFRFLSNKSKENNDEQAPVFLGFGMGSHLCPGKTLAIQEIAFFVKACLKYGAEIVIHDNETNKSKQQQKPKTTVDGDVAFMDTVIDGVPNHPLLERSQAAFLWRTVEPLHIKFKKVH